MKKKHYTFMQNYIRATVIVKCRIHLFLILVLFVFVKGVKFVLSAKGLNSAGLSTERDCGDYLQHKMLIRQK